MSIIDAILLGVVQGLTEFLPVSSSGHLIVAHELLGWTGDGSLAFDAVLHFATSLAVLVYFRSDVCVLLRDAWSWMRRKEIAEESRLTVIGIIVATIPAVVLGLLLEEVMATIFRSSELVALTLIVGSGIMYAAERWGSHMRTYVGARRAFGIGLFQSLALVPGMSRSGMAIAGGMLLGLSREAAARFAFLLAIPLLLGAGAKKILDIGASGELLALAPILAAGALSAFISGIIVVHYLMRYLRSHTLFVFVAYRLLLAAILIFMIFLV